MDTLTIAYRIMIRGLWEDTYDQNAATVYKIRTKEI